AQCAISRRASLTSTPVRSGPRYTCRSAASRTRATATARRARPRSTSSPSGSRSTSTTRASCRRLRSTPPSSVVATIQREVPALAQAIQLVGAFLILIAYVLAQFHALDPRGRSSLVLNLAGALVLAGSAYAGAQWGFLVLEG